MDGGARTRVLVTDEIAVGAGLVGGDVGQPGQLARGPRDLGGRDHAGVRRAGDQEPQAVQRAAVGVDTSRRREHLCFGLAADAAQFAPQVQGGSRRARRTRGGPRQPGEPQLERGGRAEEHREVHIVVRTRAAPVDQPWLRREFRLGPQGVGRQTSEDARFERVGALTGAA